MKAIIEAIAVKDYFLRDDSSTPILTNALSGIVDIVSEAKKLFYMGCDKCYSGIGADFNYAYTCVACKECTVAKPRSLHYFISHDINYLLVYFL
ncbi:hypothetical protein ACJIZ3_020970 [Penstemon smallii]|uniref:Uncharacterized protein n=1 Tax=Penstemon smallii TaxID=265156 RepID=A0ABD3SKM4_9LAMI